MRKVSIFLLLLLLFSGVFFAVNNFKTEKVIYSNIEENTLERVQDILGGSPTPPTGPTVTLYDGSLGTLPGAQGFTYATNPPFSASATQTLSGGGTVLDTTPVTSDAAGYFSDRGGTFLKPNIVPVLDRTQGFSVRFTVQVQSESHTNSDKNGDGLGDRAGFSLIVLDKDKQGVEMGFWTDQIWTQQLVSGEFVHSVGESASYDTTVQTTYDLTILGNRYTLSSGGVKILTNTLHDYTSYVWTHAPLPNPYQVPNFVFLGDDTTTADAAIRLTSVTVTTDLKASLLHVTNAGDSVTPLALPITLREALNNAAALGGGTITFDTALGIFPTITLTAPLTITVPVTITAIPDPTVTSCTPALKVVATAPNLLQLGNGVTLVAVKIEASAGPALHISPGKNILKCSVIKKV